MKEINEGKKLRCFPKETGLELARRSWRKFKVLD